MPNSVRIWGWRLRRELVTLALVPLCLAAGLSGQSAAVTVIEGGTLIDGTGAAPLSNAVIVMQGNRITAVGAQGQVTIPAGATRIDARGRFIIPGLIDAHAHMREDWMYELFLVHGVTSVIDQGSYVPWIMAQKDATARGKIRGPRIYTSGITFRCRGGSCRGADYQPDQLRQHVQALVKAGADLITVGQYEPPDVLRVLVDEAHKHGIPVSGETYFSREASGFGFDGVVHTYGTAMGTVPDDVRAKAIESDDSNVDPYGYLVPPASGDLRARFLKSKVFLIPMLIKDMKAVNDRQQEFREETTMLLNTPELDYIPVSDMSQSLLALGDKGVPPLAGGFLRLGTGAPTSPEYKRSRQAYQNIQTFIREYVAAGGRVLTGADVPNYNLPGISLHEELCLLVDAGLTSMQALQAATLWPAEFLRKEEELGTIRPGRYADILILDVSPLEDIANTKRLRMVFKDGVSQELRYHREYHNPIPAPRPAPTPSITDVSPSSVVERSGTFQLTVRGRDFVPESIVSIQGVRVVTRFMGGGRLVATVPGDLIDRVGTPLVTVYNPPGPRSGTSEAAYLIVTFK
jgi:hypothetical protein